MYIVLIRAFFVSYIWSDPNLGSDEIVSNEYLKFGQSIENIALLMVVPGTREIAVREGRKRIGRRISSYDDVLPTDEPNSMHDYRSSTGLDAHVKRSSISSRNVCLVDGSPFDVRNE